VINTLKHKLDKKETAQCLVARKFGGHHLCPSPCRPMRTRVGELRYNLEM